MTENEKYIYDHFLISIKSGFESLEDIIDGALEAVDDEGWQREISEEWVRETLTREYEKNQTASKSWDAETDPIKLRRAFDLLCKRQIVAVHDIGYTQSEAVYDVKELVKELEDDGAKVIGYCFYHGQDLERAVQTGTLFIGFSGIKENNEKETIAIGNKIVSVLTDAGFTIEWKNSASDRIKIVGFKWQNLFVSEEDTEEKWGCDRVFQLMKV